MNRIWWDKRPPHLRDVAGWWDYHLPRIAKILPFRCRECHTFEWRPHKLSCATGKDLAGREVVMWRAILIVVFTLAVAVVLAFALGYSPWKPNTPIWWILWLAEILLVAALPFIVGKYLRNWWMPKR